MTPAQIRKTLNFGRAEMRLPEETRRAVEGVWRALCADVVPAPPAPAERPWRRLGERGDVMVGGGVVRQGRRR